MKEDTAGAALAGLVAENGWECKSHVVVKDERADICGGDRRTRATSWASTSC